MVLSDKEVKDFEDKYKKGLLDKIIEVSLKQTKLNSQIEQFEEYMGLDPNLPNISITLNNKLVELQHQFEDAGISMYATRVENYGPLHQNFITSPFIGEAVIQDLISRNGKGIQDLANYSRAMSDISKPKIEKAKALEKVSTLRKFFLKIRSLFAPMKQQAISYTKEEKDILNSHMSEYKNTDKQLYNYNLRDNVVSSLVKYVREQGYAAYIVPWLLEELIADDLQKLGLGDLIPELQSSLIEEYKKDLPDPEIYKVSEEDMHLYVPDFNGDHNTAMEESLRELQSAISNMKTEKRSLNEGVTLEDLSSIDKTVETSERHAAKTAIKQGLEANINNKVVPIQKDDKGEDISL